MIYQNNNLWESLHWTQTDDDAKGKYLAEYGEQKL